MAASLHFYGTHSVLPLAFYTTFGKWRHTEEVTWLGSCVERECDRGGGGGVGGYSLPKHFFPKSGRVHYQADTKAHYALPILGLLLCMHLQSSFLAFSLSMPSLWHRLKNGASRGESCTDTPSWLTPAKNYLSLL